MIVSYTYFNWHDLNHMRLKAGWLKGHRLNPSMAGGFCVLMQDLVGQSKFLQDLSQAPHGFQSWKVWLGLPSMENAFMLSAFITEDGLHSVQQALGVLAMEWYKEFGYTKFSCVLNPCTRCDRTVHTFACNFI